MTTIYAGTSSAPSPQTLANHRRRVRRLGAGILLDVALVIALIFLVAVGYAL